MLDWFWPAVLIVLPAPLLIRRWLSTEPEAQIRLRVAQLDSWPDIDKQNNNSAAKNPWLFTLLIWLSWIFLILGLARPHWTGDIVELPVAGRDLMLAVDISQSMDERDMQLDDQAVNRLQVVKFVVRDFIKRRSGDRLGLILFGSNAYLQTPLTFDRATVETLLMEAELGLAGKRTAIGDAIALGAKRLNDQALESRVLVLLTDGANTAGQFSPMEATELATQLNVKIYTIGLGAESMKLRSFFGTREVNPSRDLDESSLREIAETTGGQFFRARNPKELEAIYRAIDELEPTEKDPEIYRPIKSISHYFWFASLVTLITLLLIRWSLPLLNRSSSQLTTHNKSEGK